MGVNHRQSCRFTGRDAGRWSRRWTVGTSARMATRLQAEQAEFLGLDPEAVHNVQTARVDGHGGLIAVSPEYTAVTASGAGFHSLTTEVHDHYPTVEGTIPEWLSGTLVRNGPARFEAGDRRVNHWFDGLVMLRRYAFTDGRLRYSNRFSPHRCL